MKYKGQTPPPAHRIRKTGVIKKPLITELDTDKDPSSSSSSSSGTQGQKEIVPEPAIIPEYTVKMKKVKDGEDNVVVVGKGSEIKNVELEVCILLPGVKKMSEVDIEVSEEDLVLYSVTATGVAYELAIDFPQKVDDSQIRMYSSCSLSLSLSLSLLCV